MAPRYPHPVYQRITGVFRLRTGGLPEEINHYFRQLQNPKPMQVSVEIKP